MESTGSGFGGQLLIVGFFAVGAGCGALGGQAV